MQNKRIESKTSYSIFLSFAVSFQSSICIKFYCGLKRKSKPRALSELYKCKICRMIEGRSQKLTRSRSVYVRPPKSVYDRFTVDSPTAISLKTRIDKPTCYDQFAEKTEYRTIATD